MPELDDAALERRLRGVLKEHLGSLPLDLTVDVLDRRREAKGFARRSAGGRGMTLLAAAALLLVGGALAAGAGLLRQTPVVVVATASPDAKVPRESTAPSATPIPVAGPGGVWIPVGSMSTPRTNNTAVRLLDGRVLAIGHSRGGGFGPYEQSTAELYDPVSGTWSGTQRMLKPIYSLISPVLLLDGRVLAADLEDGGLGSEVYDPASGTWTATGTMLPRSSCRGGVEVCLPAMVPLRDGKVLLAHPDAQLFDPASGTWTATGKMNVPHFSAQAGLLSNGRVLVVGGYGPGYVPLDDPDEEWNKSAEIYDPATGSWEEIANIASPDAGGTAKLLRDGKVQIVRLFQFGSPPLTGTWAEMPHAEMPPGFSTYRVLSDGTVILINFDETIRYPDGQCTAAALYDTRTETLTPVALPPCAAGSSSNLQGSSFTLLLDGTVLVAGGEACNGDGVCVPSGAAALYVPAGMPLPRFPAFATPPPPVFPSPTVNVTPIPTPRPTPIPAAAGPIPPNARSWTVTVENRGSEPAALFVANDTLQLVGSATPNVVPAGATMKVTFRFPVDGGLIYVNPRPGDGWLVSDDDIGIPGKIVVGALGGDGAGWVSP